MLKKIFCTLILCCLLLTGCSSVQHKNDYQTIKKRGKLVVGVRSDTRPFGYRNVNGKLQGFDIDLAKIIAKHIFTNENAVVFVPVTASNRISMLNSGKVDMLIATMSITDQYKLLIYFS